MNGGLLSRLLICIFVVALFLYTFINKQNEITELKIHIPKLAKQVRSLQDENALMRFEISRSENPHDLITLSRSPDFSYLKYPRTSDVIVIKEEE